MRKEFFTPRRQKATGREVEDCFDVSVREKAERNMANVRVIEMVAEHFGVSVKKVRIVNGHHHSSKLIVVEND